VKLAGNPAKGVTGPFGTIFALFCQKNGIILKGLIRRRYSG